MRLYFEDRERESIGIEREVNSYLGDKNNSITERAGGSLIDEDASRCDILKIKINVGREIDREIDGER